MWRYKHQTGAVLLDFPSNFRELVRKLQAGIIWIDRGEGWTMIQEEIALCRPVEKR